MARAAAALLETRAPSEAALELFVRAEIARGRVASARARIDETLADPERAPLHPMAHMLQAELARRRRDFRGVRQRVLRGDQARDETRAVLQVLAIPRQCHDQVRLAAIVAAGQRREHAAPVVVAADELEIQPLQEAPRDPARVVRGRHHGGEAVEQTAQAVCLGMQLARRQRRQFELARHGHLGALGKTRVETGERVLDVIAPTSAGRDRALPGSMHEWLLLVVLAAVANRLATAMSGSGFSHHPQPRWRGRFRLHPHE